MFSGGSKGNIGKKRVNCIMEVINVDQEQKWTKYKTLRDLVPGCIKIRIKSIGRNIMFPVDQI